MKKLIFSLIVIFCAFNIYAQDYKREGKVFSSTTTISKSSNDIHTEYQWKDKKGNIYDIYIHKFTKNEKKNTYGAYVIKISEKTKKEYKYYFPNNEKIAKEIMEK